MDNYDYGKLIVLMNKRYLVVLKFLNEGIFSKFFYWLKIVII